MPSTLLYKIQAENTKNYLYLRHQRKILGKDIEKLVPDINVLHNKEMFKMFGNESTHQGIVLRTSKLQQPSLQEFIDDTYKMKQMSSLCLIKSLTLIILGQL